MLTYEKVLEIFADYLAEDKEADVVRTRHCYAVMMWDVPAHDWDEVIPCETPGELFNALLEEYDKYHCFQLAESQGIDDFTPEIVTTVKSMCSALLEKRRIAENTP